MVLFKRLFTVSVTLLLGACASTNYYETVDKLVNVTPNIAYAPAIDVPYSEALNNTSSDLTVRWGGKVIESKEIDASTTRLILSQLELAVDGRPLEKANQRVTNHFVVDLVDGFAKRFDLSNDYITFYGEVAGKQLVLVNGRSSTLPILKPLEIVNWDFVDREVIANQRRRTNTYYHNVSHHRIYTGHFGHGFGSHSFSSFKGHGRHHSGSRYCRY